MAATEADIAAALIERLLSDPAFRARFRRNPALACREAGLDELADEMSLAAGGAMHTLDIRESRSSLAGVLMAAAMEGMGVYEFSKHIAPAFAAVPEAVNDVLSRVHLPALPGGGALAGGRPPVAPLIDGGGSGGSAAEAAGGAGSGASVADAAAPGGGGGGAGSSVADATAAGGGGGAGSSVADATAAGGGSGDAPTPDGAAGSANAQAAAEAKPDAAAKAAAQIAHDASPEAKRQQAIDDGVAAAARDAKELPTPTDVPSGPVPLHAAVPADGAHAAPAPVAASPADAAHAASPADAAAAAAPSGGHVDPAQFGVEGTGGPPSAESLALLDNKNVVLDHNGVADLKAGRLDPRVVAVLTKLSQDHKITVSCTASDHPKFTTGGSVSNHFLGRGADIAAIDGVPVNASNFDAREIASELAQLPASIRPNEIGSPFAISGHGFFTDADHQDHIHVGFKQPVSSGFTPPPDVASVAPSPSAASAPAAGAVDPRRSGSFLAAPAHEHAAAASARASAGFLKAVEPPGQRAAPTTPPIEAPAGDLSGVSDTYPGNNAPKAQLAAWMAKQAQARGLPRELPIMASLTESGLQNLSGGDRDSVGFFQMRVGTWDNGQYAGYPDKPELQIKWFLDQAETVKKQRIATGQPINDPKHYGDWIADIERPAAQYRGRYAEHLTQAQHLLGHAHKTPIAAMASSPPPEPSGSGSPSDPEQFGIAGTGGPVSPEAKAVLDSSQIVLDANGKADFSQGRIDPRIASVLLSLSKEHKLTISATSSDHPKLTTGGSVSNHFYGRAADIAAIDGQPVNAGNPVARELASKIAELHGALRPSEVGSPWRIGAPGFFSDRAHQNHIHVAFDDPVSADFKPPADVAPAAPPAAASAPAAGAVDPRRSGSFLAAPAHEHAAAASARASAGFLKAVEPPGQRAAPTTPPIEAPAGDLSGVSDTYPGNNAPKAQLAAWMAKQAQARGLPRELPIMASLTESGLQNLSGGDRDSVGFFQMRVGTWDNGQYAGYPDKPELQIKWFLDQAETVKKQRIATGQPINDPKHYGDWIADIERPAAQYRGRYAEHLTQAQHLLGHAHKTPIAAMADAMQPPALATAASPQALAALKEAEKYLGTPYRWGGSTPQTGFDCSGLVQWAYAKAGIRIPRVTDQQILAGNGTPVRRSELLPGDLVFFRDATGYVHHVGMSLGGDKFIHAPHTGDVVKESSLKEPYYAQQFTGGRRFAAATAGAPSALAAQPDAPAATAADPRAVAEAQAALARDAAEARRRNSGMFMAIKAQEEHKEVDRRNSMMFLKAVDPAQVKAPPAAAAQPPASAPEPPTSVAEPPASGPAPVKLAEAPSSAEPPAPGPAGRAPAIPAIAPADLASVAADYPGNSASKAQLAAWLAKQAEKHGLPPELPVMASLVESDVRNLAGGDRDSVGFFQMRVGIWNRGHYAGYPHRPELQIKWFIDHALAIKRQRIAAGDADFGRDPSKWGEWIADVERPAAQFRDRYQDRLEHARELLARHRAGPRR